MLYRKINGKPFIIDRYPFLQQIYEDQSQKIVVMKGAQVGVSEYAINKALFFLDNMGDVLYVLPTEHDAWDFSAGRVNPVVEESEYLEEFFTNVQNVGHKRARDRNFYLRGSNSRSKLKSVPIDFLVLDEFDEMVQKNIPLARDRMDASPYKWEIMISTPTIPETGIHAEYLKSDQHEWKVVCEECGAFQELAWPDSVKDDQFICVECGGPIDRWHGHWEAQNPDSELRGYHISQLMSPTITAKELQDTWNDAQGNADKLEDFYNSKLGLPYVAEGDRLTPDIVLARRREYASFAKFRNRAVMGVDVGADLHYIIAVPDGTRRKILRIGTVKQFEELDFLMTRFAVKSCVIDANPETREARKFADRNPGKVFLAYYSNPREGVKIKEKEKEIHLSRTEAIDECFARYFNDSIDIPQDAPQAFAKQMSSLVRVYEENAKGQQVAVYRRVGPDHFAHADTYCEAAFSKMSLMWVRADELFG